MATFLYTALMPDYTYDFVPSDLTRTSGTATSATYRNDGGNNGICASVRLTGTGFTYSGGIATGGTVTGITFLNSAGRSILTVTNASFDLGELEAVGRYSDGDFNLRSLIFSDDDVITTGGRFTSIYTGGGNDRVTTSGTESYISDRGGADTYVGRTEYDSLSYSEAHFMWETNPRGIVADLQAGTVRGPDGLVDTVSGIDQLQGTARADVMRGSAAAFEDFMGFRGADSIDGRGGTDRIQYNNEDQYGGTLGIVANLATGRIVDTFGTIDRVVNVENVRGSKFNDTITGSSGNNQLEGGSGNDLLAGGDGSDKFRFREDHGRDRITDFDRAEGDKIRYTNVDIDFADLTFSLVGGNRVITSPEGTITLVGFSGALNANDFEFG